MATERAILEVVTRLNTAEMDRALAQWNQKIAQIRNAARSSTGAARGSSETLLGIGTAAQGSINTLRAQGATPQQLAAFNAVISRASITYARLDTSGGSADRALARFGTQINASARRMQREEASASAFQQTLFRRQERAVAQQELAAAIASGQVPRGSFVQRAQASLAARQGGPVRLPTDFQTGRQLVGSSLLTSARFAASGALLYGGVRAITSMVKESEDLEIQLTILRSQFEALGRAGQLGDVSTALRQARGEIFSIARETGIATDQAAELAVSFIGAFGPEAGVGAERIAARLAVIAGIAPGEIFNDLVAGARAFGEVGEDGVLKVEQAMTRLGDVAQQTRNVTGVAPSELLDFLGRVGPVAETAGLALEEASAAGAALLQGSGLSGSTLGDQFSRILTEFSQQAVNIAGAVGQSPALREAITQARGGDFASFARDLNQGDASVLFDLAEGFNSLGEAQQRQIVQSVGSRREGQTLAVLLQNSTTLLNARTAAENSAGAADREFENRQRNLRLQFARLNAELQQIGLAIYQAGIDQFLTGLITTARLVIDVFGGIFTVINGLNNIAFGLPGQLVLALGTARLLAATLTYIRGLSIFGGAAAGAGAVAGASAAAGSGLLLPGAGAGAISAAGAVPAAGAAGAAVTRGAALFSRFNLGLAAASAVLFKFASEQNSVANAASNFREQLRNLTDEQLAAFGREDSRAQNASFGNALATNLFGQATPDVEYRNEIRRREANRLGLTDQAAARSSALSGLTADQREQAARGIDSRLVNSDLVTSSAFQRIFRTGAAGLVSGELISDPERLMADLQQQLDEGTSGAVEIAQTIFEELDKIPGFAQDAQAALNNLIESRTNQAIIDSVDAGTLQADIETLKTEFEAGNITSNAYLTGLNAYKDQLLSVIESGGPVSPAFREELAGIDKEVRKVLSTAASDFYTFQAELLQLQGGDPSSQLDIALRALHDPRITDPNARQQLARQVVEATKAMLQARADAATTASQEAAILREGMDIDPAAVQELISTAITLSPAWNAFIEANYGAIANASNLIAQITQVMIAQGISAVQALRQVILQRIADIDALANSASLTLGQAANLGSQRASLEDQFNNLPTDDFSVPTRVTNDPSATRGGGEDTAARDAHEAHLAALDLRRAQVEGDPVAEAAIAADIANENERFARQMGDRAGQLRAQAERVRAGDSRREALEEVAAAQRDLALAIRGDDPVGEAFNQLLDANAALANARGAAARASALADQIRAQRSLAEAMQGVFASQLDLAQAIAEAAGDSVHAAEIGLQQAEQELANVRTNTPNDEAAINQAEANRVTAEARLRDSQLEERRNLIDYQVEIGQITKGQALSAMQALLQIPNLTEDQIRDINLEINRLRGDLGKDFQFNLPELQLPTAYEVRRLGGAGGGGSSYQDNRQISVTVVATTNATPQDIAKSVTDAIGDPRRNATGFKRY